MPPSIVPVLGLWFLVLPGRAAAEHDHGGHHQDPAPGEPTHSVVTASVALVAARFATRLYVGDYQGVVPKVAWDRGRFGASASLGLYRLSENGLTRRGLGDAVVAGQLTLMRYGGSMVGISMPVSLSTGDGLAGFGMGHVMVMPAVWAMTVAGDLSLSSSFGYSDALGAAAGHDHGAWPLVEPMNMRELTWSATAELPLGISTRIGAHVAGGIPIGAGSERVTAGLRAAWTAGRVETMFEAQAGIAGDPFRFRGLLATAVRF